MHYLIKIMSKCYWEMNVILLIHYGLYAFSLIEYDKLTLLEVVIGSNNLDSIFLFQHLLHHQKDILVRPNSAVFINC